MFDAVFGLIQSCIHNKEFEDASLYAHTAHEMVVNDADGIIPSNQRERLLAEGCYWLALATLRLDEAGGIPPEEKQKAGEKATVLERQALELHTQLHGIESIYVAHDMRVLASLLDYFIDVDDDEVLRLFEQSIGIISRLEGSSSVNVAVVKEGFGKTHHSRARRAQAAHDLDRCMANLQAGLPHFREAVRIYRVLNHEDKADRCRRQVDAFEKSIRLIRIARERAPTSSSSATIAYVDDCLLVFDCKYYHNDSVSNTYCKYCFFLRKH